MKWRANGGGEWRRKSGDEWGDMEENGSRK